MAGPTTDQLVAILKANPNSATTNVVDYLLAHPELPPAVAQAVAQGGTTAPSVTASPPIVWNPQTNSYGIGGTASSGAQVINANGTMSAFAPNTVAPATAPLPGPTAPATTQPPLMTTGPGQMNVPYGADYLAPMLQAYVQMLGLGQQKDQFGQNALFNAGSALAGLYAQGPLSAAELAFRNAGMGLPAIGGNAANAADLIRASTQGGTGTNNVTMGGQGIDIPSTLGGQALQKLKADPNAAGVLASFAKAAGNPNLFARSIQALIPSGFTTVGAGI